MTCREPKLITGANHSRVANSPVIVNAPLYNASRKSWILRGMIQTRYLDRILIPAPRDSIDRKYPAGLSAGKFARYGRSPVNWHARRIAHWSARRFRCEIHFEANGNMPHSERCAESVVGAISSSFPWKILKRTNARSLRDLRTFLNGYSHSLCVSFNKFYSKEYYVFKLKQIFNLILSFILIKFYFS